MDGYRYGTSAGNATQLRMKMTRSSCPTGTSRRERVAMGEILPEWIKGKSNSSDSLTKMVTKGVVDALEDHGPEQTGTTRRYGSLPTGSHHTTGSLLMPARTSKDK